MVVLTPRLYTSRVRWAGGIAAILLSVGKPRVGIITRMRVNLVINSMRLRRLFIGAVLLAAVNRTLGSSSRRLNSAPHLTGESSFYPHPQFPLLRVLFESPRGGIMMDHMVFCPPFFCMFMFHRTGDSAHTLRVQPLVQAFILTAAVSYHLLVPTWSLAPMVRLTTLSASDLYANVT
jgi:multisubunit Na+/H+ antiporter MnhC subunit